MGLYLYAQSLGPLSLPIGDLTEEYVGRRVETVGRVQEVSSGEAGVRLILVDPLDLSEIAVFASSEVFNGVDGREDIAPAAEVQVRGELQLYRGELEILVTSSRDIVVVRGPPVMVSP